MKLKFLAAIGLAATLYSCDDTTTGVGEFVIFLFGFMSELPVAKEIGRASCRERV